MGGIDLYYTIGSGPCRAVMLTAKLLGVQLNLKPLDLQKQEHLAPEFVKLNPQHTVPTLVDNGFVLWESYAINTYLVEKYGKNDTLYPKDLQLRAQVDQKLFFDVGTLYRRFSEYFYPIFMGTGTHDAQKHEKVVEALKFLDIFLEGHDFVVGNHLTVADISLVNSIVTFDVVKFDLTPFKNVSKWYVKVKSAIPGFDEISGKEMLVKLFEEYRKK